MCILKCPNKYDPLDWNPVPVIIHPNKNKVNIEPKQKINKHSDHSRPSQCFWISCVKSKYRPFCMVFKLMWNNIVSKTETKDRKPKAIYLYLPMFQTEPNPSKISCSSKCTSVFVEDELEFGTAIELLLVVKSPSWNVVSAEWHINGLPWRNCHYSRRGHQKQSYESPWSWRNSHCRSGERERERWWWMMWWVKLMGCGWLYIRTNSLVGRSSLLR